jgi:lipoprotein-anchoring transpeptidase ErfK/SrfK
MVVSLCLFLLVTIAVLRHASAEKASPEQIATTTAVALASPTPSETPSVITFPSPVASTPIATLPAAQRDTTRSIAGVHPSPSATPAPGRSTEPVIVTDSDAPDVAAASETPDVPAEPVLGHEWDAAIHTLDGGVMAVVVSAQANVRTAPSLDAEVVTELHGNWPVTIYSAVRGDWADGTDVWYTTWSGSYISAAIVAPFIAPAPESTHEGNWVDVNISQQYAIGYVGDTPVYAAIVMTGQQGFETPVGDFTVTRRVESETMDSATVGIPKGDPHYYYLTGVKYTQYFAEGGFALHSNYWSDDWEFGNPLSHGCVDMFEDDAGWFWSFLSIGSVVSVHY